jgi:cellulose synthase/poly-beta-1,6-N-acetylglucosamine synthase-like glycosyltransferase
MAIEYNLFKKLMSEIEAVGGFDKVLQLKLLESGNMISYLQDATIFDEKVGSTKVFSNQRKRWTSSQYLYLKMYFSEAFTKLFKGNYNYFMILLIHVFPPRILLPVLLFVPFMIALVLQHHFFSFLWGITFFALVISYTIAAPKKLLFSKQIWVAFKALPSAVFAMMRTVFKLKGADETFIHTPHSSTKIETKVKP